MSKRSIRKTRHIKLTATLRGRKSELKKRHPELSDTAARARVILIQRRRAAQKRGGR